MQPQNVRVGCVSVSAYQCEGTMTGVCQHRSGLLRKRRATTHTHARAHAHTHTCTHTCTHAHIRTTADTGTASISAASFVSGITEATIEIASHEPPRRW